MKKIWVKQKNVVVKHIKKLKNLPLELSENHRSHIPVRYHFLFFLCYCVIVMSSPSEKTSIADLWE